MRIVILGAGYAGVTCAVRLARRARGCADITLVSASAAFCERIRLHQQAAGQRAKTHDIRHLLRGTGVAFLVGHATGLDLAGHTITVNGERVAYDRLVLSLGSRTDVDGASGIREHAFTLDVGSVSELAALLPGLAARGGRLVIVGAGLTGVESAAEIAEAFPSLKLTLVSHRGVGDGWSAEGRAHMVQSLTRRGVELRDGVRVRAVERERLVTDGGEIAFDACLWSVGFIAPPLAREAGLAVNERGQVLVDPALRSISHPEVYAAGDITAPVVPPGDPLPMGCKAAGPAGAHVADNLARAIRGEDVRAFDFQGPFYCVSLGRRDGLIQFPVADGSLTGKVWTGRRAAWFKELICKSTVWAFAFERIGFVGTRWMRTGHPPALDAAPPRALTA